LSDAIAIVIVKPRECTEKTTGAMAMITPHPRFHPPLHPHLRPLAIGSLACRLAGGQEIERKERGNTSSHLHLHLHLHPNGTVDGRRGNMNGGVMATRVVIESLAAGPEVVIKMENRAGAGETGAVMKITVVAVVARTAEVFLQIWTYLIERFRVITTCKLEVGSDCDVQSD
jgi:hypothetical protein